MKTKDIHISEYNYELPDERIAKFPKAERDHSKLLVYNKGEVGEDIFYNLPNYLPQGALMVYNLLSLPTTNRCSNRRAAAHGFVWWVTKRSGKREHSQES